MVARIATGPLTPQLRSCKQGLPVRVDQPWDAAFMARLYDAFPFTDDLALYDRLATAAGGEVLELGCGSGRVLVPLVQARHRVVGVDASPGMLALAGEKLSAAGPQTAGRARLVNGDLHSVDLGKRFGLAIVAVKTFAYSSRAPSSSRHSRPSRRTCGPAACWRSTC